MFPTLPVELLIHIINYIESPSDLLHTALACKLFCEIIIPYRLNFTSISYNLGDMAAWHFSLAASNSAFWDLFSAAPELYSLVKLLTLSSRSEYSLEDTFRIEEKNVKEWTKYMPLTPYCSETIRTSHLRYFLECLAKFRECRYIRFNAQDSHLSHDEVHRLVACILTNLSANLETIILDLYIWLPGGARADGVLSRCSFGRLTTFSIRIAVYNCLKDLVNSVLDSLVYGCSTLINLKLRILKVPDRVEVPFCYSPLIQDAHWPSLKRLELMGPMQLFEESLDANDDLCKSFMARHSQLESLRLAHLNNEVENMFRNPLLYQALPHLLSCDFDFPAPAEVLPQLHHISNFEIYDPKLFLSAQSLRSCTITMKPGVSETIIEDIAGAIPQLERLCIHTKVGSFIPYNHHCQCIGRYGGAHCIAKLRNLTHFGLFARDLGCSPADARGYTIFLLQCLTNELPRLNHVYCSGKGGLPCGYRVIENLDDTTQADRFDLAPQSKCKIDDPDIEWNFLIE